MKISIVTLSFNQKQFLTQAIDSVLNQGYSDLEYIVADPGSMDGSRDVLDQYRDRLAHLILEPDAGPADGLNRGFARATGEVYGFVNSDDYLLPGALGDVAAYFDRHPECDIVMGNGFIVDAEGKMLRRIRARSFSVRRFFGGGTRWIQQSAFFRASAYARVGGFNATNRFTWDGELFLDMVQAGSRIGYEEKDWGCFRMYGKTISARIRDGGKDPFVVGYRDEHERLFVKFMGRRPELRDKLWTGLYRLESALLHPREVADSLRSRLRSRSDL